MNYLYRISKKILHFKRPAKTSRGEYTTHTVWYVELRDSTNPNVLGIGECAPLPDLSCDNLPEAEYESTLDNFCKYVAKTGEIDYEGLENYPSMLFGLETALLSAKASLSGDMMRLYDSPFSRSECSIPINGLVWMGNKEFMLSQIETKLNEGFGCVKLKIGAIDFQEELSLLRFIRERFSPKEIELRVDVNGAFSPTDALEKLNYLSEFSLHSIEQPIKARQWGKMRELVEHSPIKIALDEELIGINKIQEKAKMLDSINPDYLVIKPSLHGGIRGTLEWIELAKERNIGYWLTSALESNVGLNAIAQLVGYLSERTEKSLMPQGLGTGKLFTDNYQDTQLSLEGDKLW